MNSQLLELPQISYGRAKRSAICGSRICGYPSGRKIRGPDDGGDFPSHSRFILALFPIQDCRVPLAEICEVIGVPRCIDLRG
jgi:hypothetical protein